MTIHFRGREGLFLGVVFGGFVQNDHYLDNQAIIQNSGLII